MSDAEAIVILAGAAITCAAFAVLFAKRYPKRPLWLAVGIAIGIAAMFLWPITIWALLAMWLTGFSRHRPRSRENPLDRAGAGMDLPKKIVIPLCALAALITIVLLGATAEPVAEPTPGAIAAPGTTTTAAPSSSPAPPPMPTVVDVIDGATISLDDGRTVRVIGIDAPTAVAPGKPVQCWGPESAAFARQTLLSRPVTLVADPTQNPTDDLGRTLAYVLLPDGQDFSVLATEGGYARAHRQGVPPQHHDAISAAESGARAASLGLWGPACAPPVPAAQPAPVPVPAAPAASPREPVDEPEQTPAPDPGGSAYYENCSAARAAGAAPLYAGEPGYRPGLDRDGDGVACEN